MSIIDWSPEFSVGIAEVDEQHKKLVKLVNSLFEAMSGGTTQQVVGPVLDELVNYTAYHFATEESLFAQHHYPDAALHIAKHRDLTKQAKDLQAAWAAGKTTLSVKVAFFLRDWLQNHIQKEDKAYGPFLNGKGVH